MENSTILQVVFVDGSTKTIEYDGDDLIGITKVLNKEPLAITGVQIRVVDEKGKVVFDRNFNYAPQEIIGE